jgi:hypothetical protein
MFRALLAHPQEALHKRHLVFCERISVGNATIAANSEENRIFGQGKSFINVEEGPTNPNTLIYLNTINMLLSMSKVSLSNSALVIMAPLQFKPRDGNNYNISEPHVHIWQ